MSAASRPNLLLVMADQMAAPHLAPWGGPAIMPRLDGLVADGVVFESTYSNSPLCAPARFAMMSGRRNSRIGAFDNASEFAASVPTFAHHLRSAGYQTSLVGKMHFVGPDQLHGFEERLTTDIYPADFGWTPDWRHPEGRFDWWYHNLDSVVHAGVADATNQLDFDDEVGHRAVRKLRDLARSVDRRPWMMTVSFTHPHDPYVARREYWDRYDDTTVPMPAVSAGQAPSDPHSDRLRHVFGGDVVQPTADQVRDARHAYLANCSYIDDHLGRLLDTLAVHGLAEDTIVVFTADHGDLLGERGLWYKMSFFEASARIPLVIWAPGRFSQRRVSTLSSLLDLAPTLCELAGAGVPDEFDGHSLVPQLGGVEDPDRTVVGEYLGEGAVSPIVMLRHGSEKYIASPADGEQLFDLADDPFELTDLSDLTADAGSPGPDARSVELAARLEHYRSEVSRRWDLDALHAEVLDSQAARRTVHAALGQGQRTSWDHHPSSDAANEFMRNHLDLNDVERGRRAP